MVEPRGCVELGCRYLYSYVDMLTGTQFVGCMQKVFGGEVDLESVLAPGGFGGIKMTGQAMPSASSRSSAPSRVRDAPTIASTRASSTAR